MIFSKKKKTTYQLLHEKWSQRSQEMQAKIWEKHADSLHWFLENAKQFTVSSLAGIMLLTSSGSGFQIPSPTVVSEQQFADLNKNVLVAADLKNLLPSRVQPLTSDQEQQVSSLLSDRFHMTIVSEIGGKRLNTAYGYIGQEQHLFRYPNDALDEHFSTEEDINLYAGFGIAPGLGAWGYFAPSKEALTEEDNAREKYYIAVQTFLSPGYASNPADFNNFYKYRKMFIINPQNGKAMIVDVADAGPSQWTGKQLGGSPEVMHYLERVDGAQKGPVLYFFLDDPNNQIPLGPVTI